MQITSVNNWFAVYKINGESKYIPLAFIAADSSGGYRGYVVDGKEFVRASFLEGFETYEQGDPDIDYSLLDDDLEK